MKSDSNQSLFAIDNFNHYLSVAQTLSKSSLVPKNMIGKAEDILIAMEYGNQLGIPHMQALQDIAVINGKPCMYGDSLLAIVQGHPHYEYIKEEPILNGSDVIGYSCTIKRKGHDPHTSIFTNDDAKKASLLGKPGPWSQYPKRMLQMRARGFAIRNCFADALRGIRPAEEIKDMEYIEGESELIRPQSKTEQLKQKLQGMSNDKKSKAISYDNSDSVVNLKTVVVNDADISVPEQAEPVKKQHRMGDSGKQKASAVTTTDEADKATEEQLADIRMLINDKGFSQERQDKAKKHYGINEFKELSKQKADEFLEFLSKVKEEE